MRTAIVTGSNGQDGTYLSAHLTKLGYRVIGVLRDSPPVDLERIPADELYHLAACHHSSQEKLTDDLHVFHESHAVHVEMTARLLDAIRRHRPATKLFYAASCHLFGTPATPTQDETTPMNPEGLYGITKLAGLQLCRYYRRQHGVFASAGILYNHESPLRRSYFVSKKIVEAAVAIRLDQEQKLMLGDLDSEIDLGYAGDYVVAMWQVLQLTEPGDFVISSGEKHSVREFVEEAFRLVSLDWKQYVEIDPNVLRNQQRVSLFGSPAKLTRLTGWKPTTSFRELVKIMVTAELQKHERTENPAVHSHV